MKEEKDNAATKAKKESAYSKMFNALNAATKAKKESAYSEMFNALNAATKAMEGFAQERTSKGMSVTRVKNALRTVKDVKKVMSQYGSN